MKINIEINNEDYKKANEILDYFNLNMNIYLNLAIKQLIINKGIPFEIKIHSTNNSEDNVIENKIINNDNNSLFDMLDS